MLWIEKYRPGTLDEILGAEHIREILTQFASTGSFPHLLLSGPKGSGKTAALWCFLQRVYGTSVQENTTIIPSGTLFSQGKAYLEANEKFSHLYQKNQGVLSNFKYIVRWHASLRPLNADFRVVVFDEADALTHEAQQSLRRTMERFSSTCRFVFVTTRPSALIDPLRSRSLPLAFPPVASNLVAARLMEILQAERSEGVVSSDDIELLALAVRGDLRKAIMHLQVAVETATPVDPGSIDDTETARIAHTIIEAVRRGESQNAQKLAESLMIEYGLSARELLAALWEELNTCCRDPDLSLLLAKSDASLIASGNEYLQVNALLTTLEEMQL